MWVCNMSTNCLSQCLLYSDYTYLQRPYCYTFIFVYRKLALDGCRPVLRHLRSSQLAATRESPFIMLVAQFIYLDVHCTARTHTDPWGSKH